jgi:hypothetical protein
MNFCNCPNCQTDNCPNAERESGLAECREALAALLACVEPNEIPDSRTNRAIAQARKALNPNSDVKQAFPKGRFT